MRFVVLPKWIKNLGTTGIDESASFSPNGKRVVYASKQGGRGVLTIRSLVDDTALVNQPKALYVHPFGRLHQSNIKYF